MKRILILIVLVGFFGVSAVQAQGYTAEGIRLNIGTGLWAVNPPLMPIHAGMEFGITEEISLGFDFGWRVYDDGPTHHIMVLQVRGDYYFNTLIGLDKTWDVYAGLQLGPGFVTAPGWYTGDAQGISFTADIVAGGRWYFKDGIALNAEVGLMGVFPAVTGPTPFLTFGFSFRM